MPLKIFNTLSRRKEPFVPMEPGKVRLYVCGMTVYDYCHLGHARVMVVFDTVVRYLRHLGYEVTYVRNITDIDDKIIKRAQENGEPIGALTERFIQAMHEDERALGVLPPDLEPRATQSVADMLAMIGALVDRGYAYVGETGDVYYAVQRFAGYGRLSGKNLEELRAGERVAVEEAKRDPLDFVLWKRAKPGEPAWESPFGPGRPGWHIECSAMSTRCLGNHFDIHGGGMDLQFPHHENEIAQSEGATGETFVNVWMHNGFVRVNEEKMSKSLGNFFTVREVVKTLEAKVPKLKRCWEIVRFFLLNSHYRSPLNYSDENLDEAGVALRRFYSALRRLDEELNKSRSPLTAPGESDNENESLSRSLGEGQIENRSLPLPEDEGREEGYTDRFREAMDDDFNTPEAIAVLFDLSRELNRHIDEGKLEEAVRLGAALRRLGGVLGLLQLKTHEFFIQYEGGFADKYDLHAYTEKEIQERIKQRLTARMNKDWATADRIRDDLKGLGIVLEDTATDTRWRWARD